jgi:hypothetical protein
LSTLLRYVYLSLSCPLNNPPSTVTDASADPLSDIHVMQASLDAAAVASGAPHLHYPNVPNLATSR